MNGKKSSKSTLGNVLSTIDHALGKTESFIAVFMLLVMTITVIAGVLMRYFLKIPNQFGEEIARYSMIIVAFLGVSIGVKHRAHLGITSVVDQLPAKAARIVKLVSDLIATAAFALFTQQSLAFTIQTYNKGQISAGMQMPMWMIYSALVVGFFFSTIRMLIRIYNEYLAQDQNKTMGSDNSADQNFQ